MRTQQMKRRKLEDGSAPLDCVTFPSQRSTTAVVKVQSHSESGAPVPLNPAEVNVHTTSPCSFEGDWFVHVEGGPSVVPAVEVNQKNT